MHGYNSTPQACLWPELDPGDKELSFIQTQSRRDAASTQFKNTPHYEAANG